jgi:predicted DNA-binding transcriptional regulator AlpA
MKQDKKEEILSEDEFCHYSGLPSPTAYQLEQCADYDSMGNHGRFPQPKPTSKSSLAKIAEKIKNKLK